MGLFSTSLVLFSLMCEDGAELDQETGGGKRCSSAFLRRTWCVLFLGCFLRKGWFSWRGEVLHADPAFPSHRGSYPSVPDIRAGELLPKSFTQSTGNGHFQHFSKLAAGGLSSGIVLATNPVFYVLPILGLLFCFYLVDLLGPTLEICQSVAADSTTQLHVFQSQAPKGEGGEGAQNHQLLCRNLDCRINSCMPYPCDSHLLHDIWSLCFPEHLAEWYLLSWKGKLGRGSWRKRFYASLALLCQLLHQMWKLAGMNLQSRSIDGGQGWMSWRPSLLLGSSAQATFLTNKPVWSFSSWGTRAGWCPHSIPVQTEQKHKRTFASWCLLVVILDGFFITFGVAEFEEKKK